VSAVNIAEVVSKLVRDGEEPDTAGDTAQALGLEIVPLPDTLSAESRQVLPLLRVVNCRRITVS
jgi:hypothetical protein